MNIRSITICIACLSSKLENEENSIKRDLFMKRIELYLEEILLLIPLKEIKKFRKKIIDFLINKDINKIMKYIDKCTVC